jgi:hypothetical protein
MRGILPLLWPAPHLPFALAPPRAPTTRARPLCKPDQQAPPQGGKQQQTKQHTRAQLSFGPCGACLSCAADRTCGPLRHVRRLFWSGGASFWRRRVRMDRWKRIPGAVSRRKSKQGPASSNCCRVSMRQHVHCGWWVVVAGLLPIVDFWRMLLGCANPRDPTTRARRLGQLVLAGRRKAAGCGKQVLQGAHACTCYGSLLTAAQPVAAAANRDARRWARQHMYKSQGAGCRCPKRDLTRTKNAGPNGAVMTQPPSSKTDGAPAARARARAPRRANRR